MLVLVTRSRGFFLVVKALFENFVGGVEGVVPCQVLTLSPIFFGLFDWLGFFGGVWWCFGSF